MSSELAKVLAKLCDNYNAFIIQVMVYLDKKGLTKDFTEWWATRNKNERKSAK